MSLCHATRQVQGTGKARAGATLVIGGMMFACSESLERGMVRVQLAGPLLRTVQAAIFPRATLTNLEGAMPY
jgi:hypothetical protein